MTDHTSNEGWTDGYGVSHPGEPPTGYWIASDGRWYPPELAADAQPAPTSESLPTPEPEPAPMSFPEPSAPVVGSDPGPSFDAPAPSGFGPPPSAAPPSGPSGPSFAPPSGPVPTPGAAPVAPTGSGGVDSNKLFLIIGAAVVAVLVLGGAAFAFLGGGDDDSDIVAAVDGDDVTSEEGTDTTAAEASSDDDSGSDDDTATTETTVGAEDSTDDTTADTTASTAEGSTGEVSTDGTVGAEGIVCAPINTDEYVLDVTNGTGQIVDYWLTVAFFDASGSRIGDTAAWVDSVRPGERAIETQWSGEEGWTDCEVLDADVTDVTIDEAAMADAGECVVTGADFAGDVEGEVSVTNNGTAAADYILDIALIDPSGLRRGGTTTTINQVRPGETAPGDLFTWVEHADGFTCEVISVSRYDS